MRDSCPRVRAAGPAACTVRQNLAAWRRAAAGETRLLYMAPERLMPMLAVREIPECAEVDFRPILISPVLDSRCTNLETRAVHTNYANRVIFRMEITEAQYARIAPYLPVQRGNVSLSNLQVLNAILYVAEHGCKWRGLPSRFGNGTPFTCA